MQIGHDKEKYEGCRKVSKEVINLIKKGVSINKIREQTGFGKSTIYYHYYKIKGKKTKDLIINFKNDSELGEFLGIFAGDGSFNKGANYHYIIQIHIGYYEEGYREYLYKKLPIWFNKKPQISIRYYKGKPSSIHFRYYSKSIYILIKKYLQWEGKKTYSIRLKELDFNNKEFNIGFLRGLVDTDGSFYALKRRISVSSVSEKLINQIIMILLYNCELIPKYYSYKKEGRSELYTLNLHGKNAKKFIELVKPANPNKRGSGLVW